MDTNTEKLIMYTVKDLQEIFDCSKAFAYTLVHAGGFPSLRIGGKILVEKTALEEWVKKNKGKSILL